MAWGRDKKIDRQADVQALTERGQQGDQLAVSEGVRGEVAGLKSLKRTFRILPEFIEGSILIPICNAIDTCRSVPEPLRN